MSTAGIERVNELESGIIPLLENVSALKGKHRSAAGLAPWARF